MALKPYLVQRRITNSVDGVTALAVMAADPAQARAVANTYSAKDTPQAWNNATVTEITAASTDWTGLTFRVAVHDPSGALIADVEAVSDATDNTIDEVGALLVAALNANDSIAGAAYDGTTNILKIAETTDGLGDHSVTVEVFNADGDRLPGLIGAIVDEGLANAALTVALPADAAVVPKVVAAAGAF